LPRRGLLREELDGAGGVALVAAHLRVPEHGEAVVVAREHVEAERAPVGRLLLAHAPVERVRIGPDRGVERVEYQRIGGGFTHHTTGSPARVREIACVGQPCMASTILSSGHAVGSTTIAMPSS